MENRFVIALLVDNKSGVLTRISLCSPAVDFNIDSLTVGRTEDPRFPVLQSVHRVMMPHANRL